MSGGGYFVVVTRGDDSLNLLSLLGTLNFELVTVPSDEIVEYDIVDRSAGACRVYGTVTSEGEPVDRGMILAMALESDNALGVDVKIAQIRGDGSYEFPGLAPGDYTLNMEVEGPEVRLEIEVPDLPQYRLDLPLPQGGIEGRVVDAVTGEGVDGARVILRSQDEVDPPEGLLGALIAQEGMASRTRSRGDDGEFSFTRLQAGTYDLIVEPPRWGDDVGRYAPTDPMEILVHEGATERGVEVRLEPSLVLAGRVLDADGLPVDGARVTARLQGEHSLRPPRTRAGEEGRFELRSLKVGTYDLTATADGFADEHLRGVEVGLEGTGEVELRLSRGVPVHVLVLGTSGQPVAGAVGRLIPAGTDGALGEEEAEQTLTGFFTGKGVSGTDGRLDLGRFAASEYTLKVTRGSAEATLEGIVLQEGAPAELQLQLK